MLAHTARDLGVNELLVSIMVDEREPEVARLRAYARVTFAFHDPDPAETVQRLPLARAGGRSNTRLGTEVTVGKKRLMMIFTTERAENLITAPTANFIATHQEGGFEPDSDGIAVMNFGIERPTRMMRIAEPIALGDLALERFAVRVED